MNQFRKSCELSNEERSRCVTSNTELRHSFRKEKRLPGISYSAQLLLRSVFFQSFNAFTESVAILMLHCGGNM